MSENGAALAALGVERLVCAIHDRAFPVGPDEDIGCGSPASEGGADFLEFLAENGFTGVQLGPPGRIEPGNLSPYDGTAFSRSELGVAPAALASGLHGPGLLTANEIAAELEREPRTLPAERADYGRAFRVQRALLARVHARWDRVAVTSAERRDLEARLAAFRREAGAWLVSDAVHTALSQAYGGPDPQDWCGAEGRADARLFERETPAEVRGARLAAHRERYAPLIERYAREQLLAHEQHARVHDLAGSLGLRIAGDLQVGLSHADRWANASLFLPGYALGAPPSRTNPEGQPWGYPVLDPDLYRLDGREGPALAFVARRVRKVFREYDGLRVDHPHGLVCPWVYRTDAADPLAAVQAGARLFSTPRRVDHPRLAAHALARPEQLAAAGTAAHADDWVRVLDDAQVAAYARVVDRVVALAREQGREPGDLLFEVLSTQPYPLARALARHGLGRFRITQKADVERPDDVYLPEQACAADWIMVGTHDTPPIWKVVGRWEREGRGPSRARYLARRLCADASDEPRMLAWLALGSWAMAQAELAVLFTSKAHQVMLFVSDLLGETETYNEPGVVNDTNWTLRVPSDYRRIHAARVARGAAFDLATSLTLALAARPAEWRAPHRELLRALRARARCPLPVLGAFGPAAG